MRKLIVLTLLLAACRIDAPDYSADDGGDDIDADTDVTLTVTLGGNSTGTVTAPEGIECGSECTLTVPVGTTVTLTATPVADTQFSGWTGGGCTGTEPCEVTLTADTTVEAAFDLDRFTLTVTPGGNGTGTVTADLDGIDCGDDCTEVYDVGTSVTLTAAPAADSTFLGWTGGGCTGTGPCTVDIDADLEVQASFALDNSIVVTLAGNGTGGVTSNPPGIACEDDCDEAFGPGTTVTLTALATGDSVFDGWDGGGCSGTGTCQITTDDAVLVTATFRLNQHTLDVVVTGTGSGLVTSNPPGIDCGTDCMHTYDSGTPVSLTAMPTAGKFAGWTGDCSGLGNCNLVLGLDRSVTATFTLITVTNVTSTTGNGIYPAGTSIPVLLTFTDPVIVTGAPTLALDTGGLATYTSGSGSNTLTFTYVVTAGQASSDLEYADTAALALPTGAAIENALGNDATLTLPIPGAPGSLGANKALVIDAVLPVVSAITGPAAYVSSTSASLSYTVSELHPGVTQCMHTVGTGTLMNCTNTGVTYSNLSQGSHTVTVSHADTAGNVSSEQTFSWTVDTVPPVVSAITGPANPTAATSGTLSYTINDANPGSTSCNQTAGSGTQTGCTNTEATYTGLSSGGHTVRVVHTDLAGNPSTAVTYTWTVCAESTFTFSTATTGTAFTVPAGCATRMDVYAWGAGGGGGNSTGAGRGGGAGFVGGTLTVSPGASFQIAVGGGGGAGGDTSAGAAGSVGGGAAGAGGGFGFGGGGGGGGWSGVYSGATYYLIAAGGGGGGGFGTNVGRGGDGGGGTGTSGFSASGGGGGTQAAGGSGGTGAGGVAGSAGASRQGGNAGAGSSGGSGGGGGGGGYFGGGGAGGGGGSIAGGGGGGGSSFTAGSVAGGNTVAGASSGPGNPGHPHYLTPSGIGGNSGQPGSPGRVVIVLR